MPSADSVRRNFLRGVLAAPLAAGSAAAAPGPGAHPMDIPSGLGHLFLKRQARRRRTASTDPTGGNRDGYPVEAGREHEIARIEGAGCIRHIFLTLHSLEEHYLRRCVLRAWWDGESAPSIEVPIADFFSVGHAAIANYWSLPMDTNTGGDSIERHRMGMNCFFPMPFAKGARLTVENQGAQPLRGLYWHVDYEQYEALPDHALRFHAFWKRENPFHAAYDIAHPPAGPIVNQDGKKNYVILDARGDGHYVGCNLSVDNLNPHHGFSWFGEGDDMIFIDGEELPSITGTGTEDYFGYAWGYPGGSSSTPYHGVTVVGELHGKAIYSGKWTMFRFHVEDPIQFEKSIRVTIEVGHANAHANDVASTAYWYQREPHVAFPPLLPVEKRLPIPEWDSLRSFWKTL
jgi:hypothetical protein